ncbi:hypothetical protein PG990_006675 [Apiospora arundinis]
MSSGPVAVINGSALVVKAGQHIALSNLAICGIQLGYAASSHSLKIRGALALASFYDVGCHL